MFGSHAVVGEQYFRAKEFSFGVGE